MSNGPVVTLRWRMLGRSVAGVAHARSQTPCQDANLFRVLPNGVAVAAVADGLGSAARAVEGGQLAVRAVVAALAEGLAAGPAAAAAPRAVMAHAFAAARAALERQATVLGLPLRDLATTLMAVAWGPDWLLVGHIGDGAVVGLWGDRLVVVSRPQRGEFANTTRPLTAVDALSHVYYAVAAPPTALALFSDGLQELALVGADRVPFEGFFRPLFDGLHRLSDLAEADARLLAFLDSPRVNDRTDDDKTLVLVGQLAD